MDRRGFVLAFLALGGCATLGPPATRFGPPAPLAELEPLIAAGTGPDGLTIRLASGGCTAQPDVAYYVERRAGTVSVAFARKHVDICKTAPGEVEIVFSWADLGLEPGSPVFILNPIAPLARPRG
ncbi:MAG: hypothetical protein ACXWKO_14220 [Phenylobacterium sp.]